MSSEYPEIRKMIAALTGRILTCQDMLKGQAIGNAVYGMKHMSSEYPEVRGLLRVLADKIAESNERLKPQHVGNAIYGLQSMSSEYTEVRYVAFLWTHHYSAQRYLSEAILPALWWRDRS